MTNQAFVKQTTQERRNKLTEVLTALTHESLSQDMIQAIIAGILPECQYAISVYRTEKDYYNAWHQSNGQLYKGQTILGPVKLHDGNGRMIENQVPTAAVLNKGDKSGRMVKTLIIYIPS